MMSRLAPLSLSWDILLLDTVRVDLLNVYMGEHHATTWCTDVSSHLDWPATPTGPSDWSH